MKYKKLDVEEVIANFWKPIQERTGQTKGGVDVVDVLHLADKANVELPEQILRWLVIYDEVGGWFANVSTWMILEALRQEGKTFTRRETVFSCLYGNISAQIVALRRLVCAGLDVQAKQILRVLVECLDVGVLLAESDLALESFYNSTDVNAANKFWYDHVRRGKAKARLYQALTVLLDDDAVKDLKQFMDDEERILATTIHPSMIASQMALVPGLARSDDTTPLGLFGLVSGFSERTLSVASYYMLIYILLAYIPETLSTGVDNEDEFMATVRARVIEGREVLASLFFF